MRSVTKKAAFLAAAFVVVYGSAAGAANVEVKVPFPFMVHGQMLPAGKYLVEREARRPCSSVASGGPRAVRTLSPCLRADTTRRAISLRWSSGAVNRRTSSPTSGSPQPPG